MFNHENLKGKVAVVTGGGGVLCAAFAKTLAAQGCKVAVLDLNEGAAQKCADEINANGGEAIAVGCNVLELESMENARNMKARHSKFHYMYPFLPPYFYIKIQYSKLNFNTYSILAYKMYLINTYFKYLYILLYRILYR